MSVVRDAISRGYFFPRGFTYGLAQRCRFIGFQCILNIGLHLHSDYTADQT